MRRPSAIATVLVVLCACGSSSGATSPGGAGSSRSGRAHCGPSSAKTLAVDSVARVYVVRQTVYGCASGSQRSYKLGSSGSAIRQSRADPVALGGPVAAYGLTSCGVDTCSAEVVARDLRTGRQLHSDAASAKTVGPEFVESVDAVVVKADGAVAWTSSAGSIIRHGSKELEVHKHDRHGLALLDSGPGIDTRSLKLRGSRLSWRDGGRTRAATLS